VTKKPRRPGTRAGTQAGRPPETYGATDPYERVEISEPAPTKPLEGRRKPSLGDFPAAAVAALDDLIAAAESDDIDNDPLTAPAEPIAAADIEFPPIDSVIDMPSLPHERPPRKPPKRQATSSLDDNQLVEETVLPVLPTLRFGVYEEASQLEAAREAIAAAGHEVIIGAAGREGVTLISDAIRNDDVDAVLVALPGGESIIDAALAFEPRRPVLIASVSDSAVQAVHRATTAGADLATTRPHDVDRVAPILLAAARLFHERNAALNVRGSEQVLRARLDEISDPEPRGLETFEMFQRVLEREIKRARRYEYPLAVALFAVEIPPPPPPAGIRGILRARAGNALINTIRDIDLATQLDHERFLVLLPYTDVHGAALLARRVIASVASGDPVVSSGRSFPPRVVGAVAGASEGEISFARLMKDATRALEQARRDGAELAVQP
jgi:hypothetical protein